MLKKIATAQLRPGMFIQELCGSWMEHPFWRGAFKLTDPQDLQRIRETGIGECWIDTARGVDVTADAAPVSRGPSGDEILQQVASASPPEAVARRSTADEARRAAAICAQARTAVASMFSEARMGKALDAQEALPLVEDISASVLRNPGALISLARLKTADDYTYLHSVAVCALMVALARELGLDAAETREAGMAGLLHDIGKMTIPLTVLNKPGKLTDAEFDTVRNHPAAGHALLVEGRGVSGVALDVCLHHHEKIDGSGYPDRLAGDAISLFAKMGAVCDVYDAITSDRPYKKGWEPAEALRKMAEWSHGHFEARIFHAFVKCIGIYPVGSLVRLSSGRLAVVTEQTDALLAPKVKAIFSTRSNARIAPEAIDLSRPNCPEKVVATEDPAAWRLGDLTAVWTDGQLR